ncbi:MAG: hypothetical protein KDK78_10950, partial [Chlamydiia bacterium]|nr:hypothetical protein [Chlamydiia bacterium]
EPLTTPNWHHFSLQERIDFLAEASVEPAVRSMHHQSVRRYLRLYFALLTVGSLIFFSPFAPDLPGLASIHNTTRQASLAVSKVLNAPLRQRLILQKLELYRPNGNIEAIQSAFEDSLNAYEAISVAGVFEFYAAQRLLIRGQNHAAIQLMIAAWQQFDFRRAGQDAPEHFRIVTYSILRASEDDPSLLTERLQLFEAMRRSDSTQFAPGARALEPQSESPFSDDPGQNAR